MQVSAMTHSTGSPQGWRRFSAISLATRLGHAHGLVLQRLAHALAPAVDGRADADLGQAAHQTIRTERLRSHVRTPYSGFGVRANFKLLERNEFRSTRLFSDRFQAAHSRLPQQPWQAVAKAHFRNLQPCPVGDHGVKSHQSPCRVRASNSENPRRLQETHNRTDNRMEGGSDHEDEAENQYDKIGYALAPGIKHNQEKQAGNQEQCRGNIPN